jgi:cytochrome c oxidase subunit 2
LAPHSAGADQIETLQWIGLIAAILVIVAVNAALIWVVRRYRATRGAKPVETAPRRGVQARVGGGLAAFAVVLLVLGIVFTDKATQAPATGEAGLASAKSKPLTIKATGQQWLWRYDYPNGAFSYYKLVVPVDTPVALYIESTDVVHTWNVPDLARKQDAVPGKRAKVVFSADEEGIYTGNASTFSGQAYAPMRTTVEAVSPQAYEEWVKRQKSDIEAAQKRVVGLIEEGKTP